MHEQNELEKLLLVVGDTKANLNFQDIFMNPPLLKRTTLLTRATT